MKLKNFLIITLLSLLVFPIRAGVPYEVPQEFCGDRNMTTQAGEQLTYAVYYSLAGIYVNAGSAVFTNSLEKLNGKPVYHITADGKSHSSYDWIYKVRDLYETYMDTASLMPVKFVRNVNEGGYKHYENITFNHSAGTAVTSKGVYRVPTCVQDVLSAVYNARNIDFDRYKINDKIPFKMFLDNEVHNMYIRYLGREKVKTKYGTFSTIKFKPLLVQGTIFEGGEKMTVWVTDDANHVPVRIESHIIVGSVKVDMMRYRNLRFPMRSLIKLN